MDIWLSPGVHIMEVRLSRGIHIMEVRSFSRHRCKCFLSHSPFSVILKFIPNLVDLFPGITLPTCKSIVLKWLGMKPLVPVRREIVIIVLSGFIIRMILSNFFGITLVPIQPLPIFPQLLVKLHVSFAPRLVFRFLEDEASAAHELVTELLAALVGNIVPGNDKPLTWRHVIADLVDFAVNDPPLGLLLLLPHGQGGRLVAAPRWAGLGPSPPELGGGGRSLEA